MAMNTHTQSHTNMHGLRANNSYTQIFIYILSKWLLFFQANVNQTKCKQKHRDKEHRHTCIHAHTHIRLLAYTKPINNDNGKPNRDPLHTHTHAFIRRGLSVEIVLQTCFVSSSSTTANNPLARMNYALRDTNVPKWKIIQSSRHKTLIYENIRNFSLSLVFVSVILATAAAAAASSAVDGKIGK